MVEPIFPEPWSDGHGHGVFAHAAKEIEAVVRRSTVARPRPGGMPAGVRRRLAMPVMLAIATLVAGIMGCLAMAFAAPANPLTIHVLDGPDPIASGENLTYQITVENAGAAQLQNVVLTDQVNGMGGIGTPPRLSLTSTRGSCTQSNHLVRCSAGAMEAGGSWVVTITGVVTAADGTTLNNTASVTGARAARSYTSSATATTLVDNAGGPPLPDLMLSMTGPSSVPTSAPMTYTLTVDNIGTAGATGVKVVDTLPSGLTAVSASGTSLFRCRVSGRTVMCTGGAVNGGSNATITIRATSPADTGSITNTAVVDPDDTIAEGDEQNNTAALVGTRVTAEPPPADLSIDVEDSPDPVSPGELLTYTITVTSSSARRVNDVVVAFGTQGLDAASVTAGQTVNGGVLGTSGGCTVVASQVTCAIQSLDAGGTMVVSVTGMVVASAGASIVGSATVSANVLNTGSSNTDTELTTVMPAVDLTIAGADSADPVCARSWSGDDPAPAVCGGGLIYTLEVGNSGTDEATGVDVRALLPEDAVFDSFEAPDFTGGCTASAGNVVTCTGGTIEPQSTASITLTLVAPDVTGTISSTATVDPDNAIFEADETNNSVTETTEVITGVDLAVRVDDLLDPVATSGTLEYVITVDNIGTQDVTGIRVQDVLPVGTVFLSAIGDSGFNCIFVGGIVDCGGGYLPGTASEHHPAFGGGGDVVATIVVRVFARENVGVGPSGMYNQVWVDSLQAIVEADEFNNQDVEVTDVGIGGAAMGAFNQLSIEKVQVYPPNPVARNAEVVYHLLVSNDGTDPATNVTVWDEPPRFSRVIEVRDLSDHGFLCIYDESAGFIHCHGGWILPGDTAIIEVRVFAPDLPGPYTQQSIVDPDDAIPEGNEFDNESNAVTLVVNGGNGPFHDLRIDKTGTPIATPGGVITYALQVWNAGSALVPDVVVVRDFLPEGVTFLSAQDSAPGTPGAFVCGHAAGIVQCFVASMPAGPGGSRTIVIRVLAPEGQGTITNQAAVDPDDTVPEGDELNNSAAAGTLVRSNINLEITQAGPTVAAQGTVAEYDITVENHEPAPGAGQTAFGVDVHDPLPVGLTPLAVDTGSGNNWACQILTNPINVVDCTGDLDPGQPVTIRIAVLVTAGSGRSLDNEACVDPDDEIVEFDPPGETDNCSTHTSPVEPPRRSPDLRVAMSADAAAAEPGQRLTYTITVSNDGDAGAVGPLTVTDELPGSVRFVRAVAPPGWRCTQAAGTVTCHDPPAPDDGLAPGASAQIQIQATVLAGAALPIVNTASVDPAQADVVTEPDTEHEQDLADNSATVVTSVGGSGLDLAIASIGDNPDPIDRDRPLTHTVVAVNGGDQPAGGVHVEIALPPGMTAIGAGATNGFTCGPPVEGEIDCVGDLPGGGSTVITVTSLVLLDAPDDLTLAATIDPDGDFAETDEGNNTQSEVTAVSGDACAAPPCVDLVAAQLVPSAVEARAGEPVSFALVVINAGDSPAQMPSPADPLIFFDMFGDVTLGSYASSSPAVTCAPSPFTVPGASLLSTCTGQLGPGESVTLTTTVTVNGGASVTAVGLADPTNQIAEIVDFAGAPPFGNNRIARTLALTP